MKEEDILQHVRGSMGINELNSMQRLVADTARTHRKLIVYSPTGSGKTLAFALPLLSNVTADAAAGVQALVVAPSRELVMQTAQVLRWAAQGLKVTECYGGHPVSDEQRSLSVAPAVVVATPGRLLDHIGRGHINVSTVKCLVLDEFDKSLEKDLQLKLSNPLRVRLLVHCGCALERVVTRSPLVYKEDKSAVDEKKLMALKRAAKIFDETLKLRFDEDEYYFMANML